MSADTESRTERPKSASGFSVLPPSPSSRFWLAAAYISRVATSSTSHRWNGQSRRAAQARLARDRMRTRAASERLGDCRRLSTDQLVGNHYGRSHEPGRVSAAAGSHALALPSEGADQGKHLARLHALAPLWSHLGPPCAGRAARGAGRVRRAVRAGPAAPRAPEAGPGAGHQQPCDGAELADEGPGALAGSAGAGQRQRGGAVCACLCACPAPGAPIQSKRLGRRPGRGAAPLPCAEQLSRSLRPA